MDQKQKKRQILLGQYNENGDNQNNQYQNSNQNNNSYQNNKPQNQQQNSQQFDEFQEKNQQQSQNNQENNEENPGCKSKIKNFFYNPQSQKFRAFFCLKFSAQKYVIFSIVFNAIFFSLQVYLVIKYLAQSDNDSSLVDKNTNLFAFIFAGISCLFLFSLVYYLNQDNFITNGLQEIVAYTDSVKNSIKDYPYVYIPITSFLLILSINMLVITFLLKKADAIIDEEEKEKKRQKKLNRVQPQNLESGNELQPIANQHHDNSQKYKQTYSPNKINNYDEESHSQNQNQNYDNENNNYNNSKSRFQNNSYRKNSYKQQKFDLSSKNQKNQQPAKKFEENIGWRNQNVISQNGQQFNLVLPSKMG
ncbi:hypothetical protein PPERSA_08616 [Pseudocohnilembus persalinus]|uniref:Transmembrane protein n=1 Tax=Pseudocohnilembus persalinus TaxID=266149 RepID=A0A0V0R5G7_PSEPJ|nr:hypothetical protein PPERSA_08616 [Pseudocohnilembus persalinus]|eukprot:KRX09584.1 hypothetical protein PPERSA_08616 [Pseudocohnilembus persalinus]